MIQNGFPSISTPLVDQSGRINRGWFEFFAALYDRTGDAVGVDATAVAAAAVAAATAAATAQTAAAAAQSAADAAQASANGKVSKSGDVMTGLLVLSGDPAAALGAVTKQYADVIGTAAAAASATAAAAQTTANAALPKSGGTMTGGLILSGATGAVSAGTAPPIVDGAATVGTSNAYARQDHIHPTDTTRYAASNPSGFLNAAGVDGHTFTALKATGGLGVFGHAPPAAQPATPVTLADVIAILQGAGLCL